jgi:release factor glutamine methyltransferase
MTVKQALIQAQERLRDIPGARLDSELLLAHVLGKNRTWLTAHSEDILTQAHTESFEELVAKRADRTPVVQLTNTREFYGLDLYIDENVLTPRVETETMVDWAIKYAPRDSKLIDIGTGSGALAVAIKKHRPDLEVWATDVSEKELAVAKKNIAKHKLNINCVQSDLFASIREKFSTVVTNLPYLRDDAELMPEVQKEPAVALFGGEDGLDIYRRFLTQLPNHLEPGGYVFTECDTWQQVDLIEEAAKIGLNRIEEDRFILGFRLN